MNRAPAQSAGAGRPDRAPLSNARSDRVRAVAALATPSGRRLAGRFLVEGPQAVREAAASAAAGRPSGSGALRELYTTPAAARRHRDVVDLAEAAGVVAREVSDDVLAAMVAGTGTSTPQGLLAVCDLLTLTVPDVLSPVPELVALLSQARDPGNAGTVIRTADAAGAGAVVLTGASVDVHNPKVVRATAGSLFHLPVAQGGSLQDAVALLGAAGLTVLAADGAGDLDLDDLVDAGAAGPLAGRVAWVFGNEAWGLAPAERALADGVVRVPVHGRAESWNLAAAATLCLYLTARTQRSARHREPGGGVRPATGNPLAASETIAATHLPAAAADPAGPP